MSSTSDFVIENGVLKTYVGPGGEVVVPEDVTFIGGGGSVQIPEGVTLISEGVFKWCDALTEILIPGSVKVIKPAAFEGCSQLKHVVMMEGAHIFARGRLCQKFF